MTGQGDLLDALAAQAEAIERVERNAAQDWKDHVLDVIW